MQLAAAIFYKGFIKAFSFCAYKVHYIITCILFYLNRVEVKSFDTRGVPFIMVSRTGKCSIGSNLRLNNVIRSNPVGKQQRCVISVFSDAEVCIGNNVGMSFTTISCSSRIIVGNNVLLGAGVCIYDSDFHPLDSESRIANLRDRINSRPVIVEDNVFIGSGSMILKGVVVGKNSVIGACSVVSASIPPNQIWAGNPAKFIKNTV